MPLCYQLRFMKHITKTISYHIWQFAAVLACYSGTDNQHICCTLECIYACFSRSNFFFPTLNTIFSEGRDDGRRIDMVASRSFRRCLFCAMYFPRSPTLRTLSFTIRVTWYMRQFKFSWHRRSQSSARWTQSWRLWWRTLLWKWIKTQVSWAYIIQISDARSFIR